MLCSDGSARIATVRDERLEIAAELPAVAGAPGGAGPRIASIAALESGGVLVADTVASCVWRLTEQGGIEPFAGRPLPFSLDARRRAVDGPVANAEFRAPGAVASAGATVYCGDAAPDRTVVRRISDGHVETIEPSRSIEAVASIAPAPGGLYITVGVVPAPCVFYLGEGGDVRAIAGSPSAAGGEDGPGARARFARPAALAADGRGGCFVADGVRVRRIDSLGEVTTVAGGPPGFVDGPAEAARFGPIAAIASARDGSIVVADPANRAIRWIDASGDVSTICSEDRLPSDLDRTIDEAEARALARSFGSTLVDGDLVAAEAIAERFLADHRSKGDSRPDRLVQPVSVASARVGRELALRWSLSDDPRRSRLGAYCLWLIRSEERIDAPREDVVALVEAVAAALDSGDLRRAATMLDAIAHAFPPGRRRDRLAVSRAFEAIGAVDRGAGLLASSDAGVRRVGVDLAEQSRDVRFTPALASLATVGGAEAARARRALRAIWEMPCYTREQLRGLREGLRFTRPLLARLGEEHLGAVALRHLHRAIEGRG